MLPSPRKTDQKRKEKVKSLILRDEDSVQVSTDLLKKKKATT